MGGGTEKTTTCHVPPFLLTQRQGSAATLRFATEHYIKDLIVTKERNDHVGGRQTSKEVVGKINTFSVHSNEF